MDSKTIIGCIMAVLFLIGGSFISGMAVMLLWNWIVPVFWDSAPVLTWWQAFGAMLLVGIIGNMLFGSKS